MLERIQREGGLSVAELARAYSVSAITVHRDLEQLAAEGLVERVHGGARALVPPTAELAAPAIATAWSQRVGQEGDAKEAIAARAAELVTPGSTVFLDSSSSALVLTWKNRRALASARCMPACPGAWPLQHRRAWLRPPTSPS